MRINQGHILQKIRQYLVDENRDPSFVDSFFNKQGDTKGFCQGFTNIWETDPRWFFSMLEKISHYGESTLSTAEKSEIETFISNLKFYQSPYSYVPAGQGQLDKIDTMTSGEQGSVRVTAGKAVLVTEEPVAIYKNLQELFVRGTIVSITLEAKIINPKTGKEEFQIHQVSSRMNADGSFAYYDPNSKTGEKIFSGKTALLRMAEEIANWNREFGRKEFHMGLIAFNKVPLSQQKTQESKDEKISAIFYQPKDINLALSAAARVDDLKMIKTLLKDGADPDYKTDATMTPLCFSARAGHIEAVNCMLDKSSPKNITKSLMTAAKFGQLETTQVLLKKLSELTDKKYTLNEYAGYALIEAAKGGRPHVVKELLEYKIPNPFLTSALRAAFEAGSLDIQHILIDNGANLNQIDKNGLTLLEEAFIDANVEKIKRLLSLGADPNANGQAERLFESIELIEDSDSQAEIKRLLILSEAKVPVELQPLAMQTALMTGRHDILKSLLENGADPNIVQAKTMTPLIIAIGKFDFTAIDLLLSADADPRITAPASMTSPLIAVKNMLTAATSASDKAKVEKLTEIQKKLTEHLQKTLEIPQKPSDVTKESVQLSSSKHARLTSCKPKDNPEKSVTQLPTPVASS